MTNSIISSPFDVGTGGDLLGFEMEGFSVCNTDGTDGLTFDEIMECKVCYKIICKLSGTNV